MFDVPETSSFDEAIAAIVQETLSKAGVWYRI
jgi:hypothetical protein